MDGQVHLAAAAGCRSCVWNLDGGDPLWRLVLPSTPDSLDADQVSGLALGRLSHGDVPYVVVATSRGEVIRHVLDGKTLRPVTGRAPGTTIIVTGTSAAGRDFFATAGRSGGPQLWDARAGEMIGELEVQFGWVSAMTTTSAEGNGPLVVAATVTTDGVLITAWDPDNNRPVFSESLTDVFGAVLGLEPAFSADSRPLLVGITGEEVVIIDVTGQQHPARSPLPAKASGAAADRDLVAVAARAGFLLAKLRPDLDSAVNAAGLSRDLRPGRSQPP
jgi:hypothetical protein